MSLKDRLLDDMKSAMKNHDKLKLSVIRMARAAIKNMEIERKIELDDNGVIEVLAKEVKQRRDAIPEYEKAGRNDIVETLNAEIKILMDYLPQQLSPEELTNMIRAVIEKVGAQSAKDMDKVMSELMPKVKGRADGKLVNQIVKDMLSN